MVSVDVKHDVYVLTPMEEKGEGKKLREDKWPPNLENCPFNEILFVSVFRSQLMCTKASNKIAILLFRLCVFGGIRWVASQTWLAIVVFLVVDVFLWMEFSNLPVPLPNIPLPTGTVQRATARAIPRTR